MNKTTQISLAIIALILASIFAVSYLKAPASLSTIPPVTSSDWQVGDPRSKVTLVEYADFQCGACGAYAPVIQMVKNEYKDKGVLFVYRPFPLPGHANAIPAAVAAEAAGAQGKYFEMSDKIFANQSVWAQERGPKVNEIFLGYAKELGLDIAKYEADIADPALKTKIAEVVRAGVKSKVNSTPTFFLQGVKITNPTGNSAEEAFQKFKVLIDAELAKVGATSDTSATSTPVSTTTAQ